MSSARTLHPGRRPRRGGTPRFRRRPAGRASRPIGLLLWHPRSARSMARDRVGSMGGGCPNGDGLDTRLDARRCSQGCP
jgi:hypothetical protein